MTTAPVERYFHASDLGHLRALKRNHSSAVTCNLQLLILIALCFRIYVRGYFGVAVSQTVGASVYFRIGRIKHDKHTL